MAGFLDLFGSIDTELFKLIHSGFKNPLFDVLMPILSNPFPHWKVLAGVIWCGFLLFGPKRWRLTLLFLGVGLGVSDFISSQVLKELIRRPRPFGGRTFSFPSSHATNFFCSATFLYLQNRKLWPLFILGLFVGYSRVYLGSHYPLDVLGGIVVGVGLGFAVRIVQKAAARRMPSRLRHLLPLPQKDTKPTESDG